MASIEERVENLIGKTIEDLGYNLYDVQYVKEGKDYFLRVFIDKPEGIDLQDCEKVNDAINDMLDDADYIKETYFLEVSSPGIERVLRKERHFQEHKGEQIEVKLFKPYNQQKVYIGILKEVNEEVLILEEEEKQEEIAIDRKNIANVKIKYNW
ncbi:MAG: ribosome maturation factor RimP [Clostridia bacterium]